MSGIVVILWLGYAQNFILQPVSQIVAEISPVVPLVFLYWTYSWHYHRQILDFYIYMQSRFRNLREIGGNKLSLHIHGTILTTILYKSNFRI